MPVDGHPLASMSLDAKLDTILRFSVQSLTLIRASNLIDLTILNPRPDDSEEKTAIRTECLRRMTEWQTEYKEYNSHWRERVQAERSTSRRHESQAAQAETINAAVQNAVGQLMRDNQARLSDHEATISQLRVQLQQQVQRPAGPQPQTAPAQPASVEQQQPGPSGASYAANASKPATRQKPAARTTKPGMMTD